MYPTTNLDEPVTTISSLKLPSCVAFHLKITCFHLGKKR
uniref:Uncharacterized protein n=1 Tax=Arundo donax TaxID=35708 RepID=A0A0A8Z0L8_ARUDO